MPSIKTFSEVPSLQVLKNVPIKTKIKRMKMGNKMKTKWTKIMMKKMKPWMPNLEGNASSKPKL